MNEKQKPKTIHQKHRANGQNTNKTRQKLTRWRRSRTQKTGEKDEGNEKRNQTLGKGGMKRTSVGTVSKTK